MTFLFFAILLGIFSLPLLKGVSTHQGRMTTSEACVALAVAGPRGPQGGCVHWIRNQAVRTVCESRKNSWEAIEWSQSRLRAPWYAECALESQNAPGGSQICARLVVAMEVATGAEARAEARGGRV